MDWTDLKGYVGAGANEDDVLERLWALASALVDGFIGTTVVPLAVRNEAVLQTAAELFDRSQTPTNVGQYTEGGGVQLRVTRDPLRPAYALLRPWVLPF